MNRNELRNLIFKEMKMMLQDDALFKNQEIPGILPDFDIPGDESKHRGAPCKKHGSHGCKKCKKKHHHSSYMARPQLYGIVRDAINIFNMIDEGEMIDDWMESHIAQASKMLDSVNSKLEYKEASMDHGHMKMGLHNSDE